MDVRKRKSDENRRPYNVYTMFFKSCVYIEIMRAVKFCLCGSERIILRLNFFREFVTRCFLVNLAPFIIINLMQCVTYLFPTPKELIGSKEIGESLLYFCMFLINKSSVASSLLKFKE